MKLISSINISQPRDVVWEIMNDPKLFSQWQKGYESTVILDGVPGQKGARARHIYMENGKKFRFSEEVLESTPPSNIIVTLDSDVMKYHIHTELNETDNGTIVSMKNDATMKAFSFRVLSPFLRKSFQKRQDEDLQRLKKLVESRTDR